MVPTIDPKWKHIEEMVASLEQSLSPMAEVRHNVMLPVLGMPGEMRQCDVVITYTDSPRSFFVIVEVQDRKRKPTITEFQGWVAKMREVGANALICISEQGYPDSIKKRVLEEYGPSVILLTTLKELEEPQILKSRITPEVIVRYYSLLPNQIYSEGTL